MGRFPFGIPNSWFHVAWSDEIAPGEVKPLRYLDRDLVLFRGEDGTPGVLDAYCPHLGAHIGLGGKVVGSDVQCPFHAWRFDVQGRCTHVPYAKKIPPKARARAYPVDEVNGGIWVWHHAEGKEPWFKLPVIAQYGNEEWTSDWQKYEWTVKTQPQEVMENAVDWYHFQSVHGMDVPGHTSEKFEGPMFYWNIQTRKDVSTMEGTRDELRMEAQNWGLGFNFLTYDGMFHTVVTAALTPVDRETLHYRVGIIGKREGRSEEETRALLKAYMDDQCNAIEQDFVIWEHKRYQPNPVLCEADKPIGEYRRWARQFYSTPPDAAG